MDAPAAGQPRADKLDRTLLLGERRNDLLTLREVERYGRENVELLHEGYETGLPALRVTTEEPVVVFVAPPWGRAFSAEAGLDLRATTPPVAQVLRLCAQTLGSRPVLFAVQVFEQVEQDSLADVTALLDRWELMIYDLDAAGHNHGVLLGTLNWSPA